MEEWVFILVFRVTIFSFLRRCWCGRDCPANMYEDILDSPKTKSITVSPYFSLCCYLQRVSLPLCTVNRIGADFLCCYFKSQNSLNKILDSSPQQLLKPPRPVEICSSQHLNVQSWTCHAAKTKISILIFSILLEIDIKRIKIRSLPSVQQDGPASIIWGPPGSNSNILYIMN